MPSASSNRPRRPTTALASDADLQSAKPPADDLELEEDSERDDQGGFLVRHGQELSGIGVGTLAVLIFVSLMSYQPALPPEPAGNLIGPAGSFFADTAYWLLGAASYFFVVLAAAGSRALFVGKRLFGRWEEAAGYGLSLLMIAMLFELISPDARWFGHQLGGWLGEGLALSASAIIGRVGATVCGVSLLLMAFVLVTESSVVAVAGALWARVAAWGEGVHRDAEPKGVDSDLVPVGPRLRYEPDTSSLVGIPAAGSTPAAVSSAVTPDNADRSDDAADFDDAGDDESADADMGVRDELNQEHSSDTDQDDDGEDWGFDEEHDEEFSERPVEKVGFTQSLFNSISRVFGRTSNDTVIDDETSDRDEFEYGEDRAVELETESPEWVAGWSLNGDENHDDTDEYDDSADDDDESEVAENQHGWTAGPAGVEREDASAPAVFSYTESPLSDDDDHASTGVFRTPGHAAASSQSSKSSGELGTWEVESGPEGATHSAVIRRPLTPARPASAAPAASVEPDMASPSPAMPRETAPPSPASMSVAAPRPEPAPSAPVPARSPAPAASAPVPASSSPRSVVTDDDEPVWVEQLREPSAVPAPSRPAPTPRAPVAQDRPITTEISDSDVVSVTPQEAVVAGPIIFESEAQTQRKKAEDLDRELPRHRDSEAEWKFPPMSYLRYEESAENSVDHERLKQLALRLEEVLVSFKVAGEVTGVCPGPVVTRFEFEPETGTKLSKISGLSDDIAMALKAVKVRIIAPIPGKGCVGIEVPNDTRENVYLKEILADERFIRSRSPLTVALGKDIEGFPVVADFAKMPHLLIAGTTGSGKSVTVNAMITSILYNASPDDVKMILIDPKQLEFAIYQDMPHLMLPVVTDPAKANTALQWAVTEMELRYKLMAEMRVRNLAGYNQKLKELERNAIDAIADPSIRDPQIELLDQVDENDELLHKRMYYIVIIVDEFADLMMTSGKEVEVAVARLAQKARAAGIHIMLATQRPSVDVLTGVIKSNFPTRMSCRLMSGTDSRTVLDSIGAENLLGMGDMLYRPNGSQDLIRVHGAYVDEREIEQIVDFLKKQRPAQYDERILAPPASDADGSDEEPMDENYEEAVQCVIDAGFASISMLQRHLRVGYNRAARMVDAMEREGVIGPSTGGSARREVLVGQLFKN